jgi:quinol monooxygenase YgiN
VTEREGAGSAHTTDASAEPDITLQFLTFTAGEGSEAELGALLARYTVLTRMAPGCINVDLTASMVHPGRFVVVEKWRDDAALGEHLSGEAMTDLAGAAPPLLALAPEVDVAMGISVTDLS